MARTSGTANGSSADLIALIPLRTGGKSRLGGLLGDRHRDELVLAMLDDVIEALHGADVQDVRILAGDAAAAAAAADRGLPAITDPEPSALTRRGEGGPVAPADRSLRSAVDAALSVVGDRRARLVVAADLPRLRADEVRAVHTHPADVVVAPTSGGGTGLLRLAPGVILPSRYGPGSAHAHLEEADRAGRSSASLELPGAHRDVDAARDLTALTEELHGPIVGAATAAFLAGLRG